jgi:hypothetical protein
MTAQLHLTSCLATHGELGTIARHAVEADLPYIDALRKKHGGELGFIPLQTYESVAKRETSTCGVDRWKHDWLLVCEDNGDLTGFCYAGFKQRTASIVQICIQQDARRWQRAAMLVGLVEDEARRRDCWSIKARVAEDIEAVKFWSAIGFCVEGQTISTWHGRQESKSKRKIDVYRKHFLGFGFLFDQPKTPLLDLIAP